MHRRQYKIDEPVMSDKTIIMSVEDLIQTAFGPMHKNTVNFKLVQTILHILARQLRLLEQHVQIKFDEFGINVKQDQQAEDDEYDDQFIYTSSSSGDEKDVRGTVGKRDKEKRDKKRMEGKEEKQERDEKGERQEKAERGEKGEKREKQGKGEKKDGEEKGGRGGKGEKKEKRGKGEKEDGEEEGGQRGKGKKKEKRGKGEKEDGEGKGERGEKTEKRSRGEKEGKTSYEKDGEDRKSRDKESPDSRGRKGDDDKDKSEERRKGSPGKSLRGKKGDDTGEKGEERRRGSPGQSPRGRKGDDDGDEVEERRRGSPGKSSRGKKGDDDGDKGVERLGGRTKELGGERGADRKGDRGKSAAREESGSSITVTEASRKGGRGKGLSDTLLVAERGPAARDHPARVGSIEVVTASQFALLEQAVKQLEQVSGPPPVPTLPDNEQLRKDLAEGRASLSDTMQAVQLNARVQTAEQGLSRMAELLTQLARAGALPLDLADRLEQMQVELNQSAFAAGLAAAGTARFAAAKPGGADTGRGGADTGRGGTDTGRGGTDTGRGGTDTGRGATDTGLGGTDTRVGGAGAGKGRSATKEKSRGKERADQSTMARMISGSDEGVAAAGAAGASGSALPQPPPSPPPPPPGVTHQEMHDVLEYMKEAISKEIQNLTARANHSADVASNTSRNVAQKLATAQQIDARITNLFSQTADYADQLSGFDSGLTTQMMSFQEQMTQIRKDLTGGLALLATANNNAETAAIMDLNERYESLVIDLDSTVHLHQNLSALQKQLSDELKSLVECVEMLREQKADRDEVLDGLRDKADISRLAGLLYEKDFVQACSDIEKRLAKCYDKFNEQDQVWQTALDDLTDQAAKKAEFIALKSLKDFATQELNNIQEQLRKLEIMLGEPKAALLMRKLARDATCGACLTRALMVPVDDTYGKPRTLPPLRPAPLGAEDVCLREVKLAPIDTRDHICNRWVGGSHTLVGGHVTRVKAGEADLQAMPTKKFEAYGTDGKLYMMEEDLQPCAECNKLITDDPGLVPHSSKHTGGGGDQARD